MRLSVGSRGAELYCLYFRLPVGPRQCDLFVLEKPSKARVYERSTYNLFLERDDVIDAVKFGQI